MTVPLQPTVFQHVANGVATTFAFDCLVLRAEDLAVYLNGMRQTAGFNVYGLGTDSGGVVVFSTAPANGVIVTLSREVELERETDYQANGDLRSPTLNNDFDRLWMAMQQHWSRITRAVQISLFDPTPTADLQLPTAAERANQFLVFDASGRVSVSSGTGADSGLRGDLSDTSNPSQGSALVGYKGRTVASRLGDIISVKDFGAVGDGVADDTDAFEACLAAVFASGRGADIMIPPGTYNITRSLQMHPDGANRPWRNITFRGQGDGYASNPSVMLRYRATSSTDSGNYSNGLIDAISVTGLNFEGICFLNDAEDIDQIIWIHAEDAGLLSSWKVSFKRCAFQNPASAAKELGRGHVWLYNSLDVRFEQCWFFGSPVNVVQGCDPSSTSGIAGGFTGRVTYDNCYFTGDVLLRRTEITHFSGCVLAERWNNSGAMTDGARIVGSSESWANNLGVNIDGVQFEGLFNPTTTTAHAIFAENISGLVCKGSTFGSGYASAISMQANVTGVVFQGNFLDLGGPTPRGITIAAANAGSLKEEANVMSAAMVAAGGAMIADARAYQWPRLVNLSLSSNYAVNAANTWESVLTSAPVSYPAGRYRIRAQAALVGGGTNTNLAIRVASSDGHGSSIAAMQTMQSGEMVTATIDELVILPAGSSVTWHLQVYEVGSASGEVRALSVGAMVGTKLEVTYEG